MSQPISPHENAGSEPSAHAKHLEKRAWLSRLNPQQYEAVVNTEGPLLMLAGAGTGKTRTLTSRIAYLVSEGLAQPEQILAVTFTNKAAREMRERVSELLDLDIPSLWLGTFHSLCARMLRRHAEFIDRTARFTILDTRDQERLVKQALIEHELDLKRWPPRVALSLIQRWKDAGLTPEQAPKQQDWDAWANGKLVEVYKSYQAQLAAVDALDFGDLLLGCLVMLRNHPHLLKRYQEQFSYVLVDEVQDTNRVQYEWLRLLAAPQNNLACVGDDDQAIYGWRGADVGNILGFDQDFPDAKLIRLEQNYRSSQMILSAAGGLISHNQKRLGKALFTHERSGEPVQLRSHLGYRDEADWIGSEIVRLRRGGHEISQMAILTRNSSTLRVMEERLLELGLPYTMVGGPRFYERQEIREAVAYLRLVAQVRDSLAFERICNRPARRMSASVVKRLREVAEQEGLSLYEAAEYLLRLKDEAATQDEALSLKPAEYKALKAFYDLVEGWRQALTYMPPAELVDLVLEQSGYLQFWRDRKEPDAPGRVENLLELSTAVAEFDQLQDFLDHVALVLDATHARKEVGVWLMTIHAAKGLEFETVFLPAWEEITFPSKITIEERGLVGLEEERRLAYVAMTRAKSRLYISYAHTRLIAGRMTDTLPSRFVNELPPSHVERHEVAAYDQGDASSHLWRTLYRDTQAQIRPRPFERAARRQQSFPNLSAPNPGFAPDVGQRVFHTKYGYGHVILVDGHKVDVSFDKAGEKRLMASYLVDADKAKT